MTKRAEPFRLTPGTECFAVISQKPRSNPNSDRSIIDGYARVRVEEQTSSDVVVEVIASDRGCTRAPVGRRLFFKRDELFAANSKAEHAYFGQLVKWFTNEDAVEMERPVRPEIADEELPTVAVIACSATKLDHAAPAKDLYQGNLFKLARRYCEARGLPYVIVSAKHGVVEPDTVLEPYDQRVPTRRDELVAWIQAQDWRLYCAAGKGMKKLVLLCGADYRQAFDGSVTPGRNWDIVEAPLVGMGLGHQMQWLKRELAELEAEVSAQAEEVCTETEEVSFEQPTAPAAPTRNAQGGGEQLELGSAGFRIDDALFAAAA